MIDQGEVYEASDIEIDYKASTIKLPKTGAVKAVIHRKLPAGAIIKSATVSRDSAGRFFVSIGFFDPELSRIQKESGIASQDRRTIACTGLDYSSVKLYYNELIPERFGRKREYALGKQSGRANIAKNLEELGLELTPEQTRRVTQRITELGDKKEIVTQDDLPYIVSDVLKHDAPEDKVKLISYVVSTAYGLKPGANVRVEINGQQYEAGATGDGQYDAFVKALRYIYKKYLNRTFPILANYQVTIPPGGRTDALVQAVISWHYRDGILRTRGLDADQTEAAIKATFKMLNIVESNN